MPNITLTYDTIEVANKAAAKLRICYQRREKLDGIFLVKENTETGKFEISLPKKLQSLIDEIE